MIICPKCKAENSPASERCVKCGFNLLPKMSAAERIVALVIGILCLFGILFLSIKMIAGFWIGIFILGGITAAFFKVALSREPIADRYAERANKYKESDPEQAVADYTQSIELGNKSPKVIFERGKLHKKLGRREEALCDLNLAFATSRNNVMKKEIEKEIQAISTEPPQIPRQTLKGKYCRYCGASISIEATYCTKCGKQQ